MTFQSNLVRRTLSALILMPLALLILFKGNLYIKQGMIILLGMGMAYEWGVMSKVCLAYLSTPILITLLTLLHISTLPTPLAFALIFPFLIIYGRRDWIYSAGTLYISLGTLALFAIISGPPEVLLWILIITWTGDVFAYLTGRSIGGPKLWVSISPNKTWAGLIGGTLAATLVGGIFGWWMELSQHALLLSLTLSLTGHGGDLLESATKRHYDVKDSGQLIPGHGGILDRLDSLILMAMVFVLLSFF